MNWYFIDSDACTGRYNMDFDLQLADRCTPGESYFRLYRWNPYCISLGAGQDFSAVNMDKAAEDGLDVVRRPTGGRAVLHAEEITYSVILPLDQKSSAKEIYFEINAALSEGLRRYHPLLSDVEMEKTQTNLSQFYKTPAGSICFAAPSKNELKFSGRKIVGSAQRKLDKVILQHGSILCGSFHKKITSYLYLNDNELISINRELEDKTSDISSILGLPVDYDLLKKKLIEGFECYFNIKFL